MRTTKLTMKAFGSYAKETSIDFDTMTGGLYLIVGKTGAGKTTIFDAICFALFGCPSGSDRTVDMLHSDFVPMSQDTEVALDFLHQGRRYHVERSIHFRKKRGTENYNNAVVSARMTGDEQSAIDGARNVTARCEELLGLSAVQFKRIVMLAQGEFREFLKAGSDKKNEILGRLFDNTEYLRFQNLLSSVRGQLKNRRDGQTAEIQTVMQSLFRKPEEMEELEAEKYLAGHPQLTENLRSLVEQDEARLEELKDADSAQGEAVALLTRREGAAAADNALLDELETRRGELSALEARSEQVAAQQEQYQLAEKALHRVKPCLDAVERARTALEQTRTEIGKQEQAFKQQYKAQEEAQAALDADAPKREQADCMVAEASVIENALPAYQTLAEKETEREETQRALDTAQEKETELETRKTELADTLRTLREELKELDGCEVEAVRLDGLRSAAQEKRNAVAEEETGIAAQVEAVLAEEEKLSADRTRLGGLTAAASEAEEHFHTLYQTFLSGQAGLIARDMEQDLAETGRTVCPVCNTQFSKGEAHCFALSTEYVPDRTEVEQADAAAKKAEERRQNLYSDIETRSSLLEQRKVDLVAQMRKQNPDCADWETLAAPGWLKCVCERLEKELAAQEAACVQAEKRCTRKDLLLHEETETVAAQEVLDKQIAEQHNLCEELRRNIHGLESAIEELRKQLPFMDQAAALEKLSELNREKDELLAKIAADEAALNKVKEDAAATAGVLTALRAALPEQESALSQTQEALTRSLAENDFSDLDNALAALAPIGDDDGEEWLLAQQKSLHDYTHALGEVNRRIEELMKQTEGKVRVDLAILQEQLAEARAAQKNTAEEYTKHSGILDNHRMVLEKVSAATADLAGTSWAWKRIDRLVELATGARSDIGKLSFDRYVMGTIFRDVLEMANLRLSIMTGGRFELIHTVDAGRINSAAGFEIEVLDASSGKQRASGSISGGEGFMVSLSLALGLSDVVQNHAGGQKLDTLFIDEGFGTLDDGKLDNVISVLQQLTEGNRLVGIISHVDKLEESIPQKLRVTSTEHGSTLSLELS